MVVLWDGMGGHEGGEIGSEFVSYEVEKGFEEENVIEINGGESWLGWKIKEMNFEV
ncbi:protein phosphatase 2C domain-containing protein [Staphylococcus epidermidis]|uniref:hypothetical protein n=1 Tax=Staphylococcus epidermidis TaxID=1282 RepID=UPI00164301B6|nr:hypothetical protein [Staphylococcus epidermidis]